MKRLFLLLLFPTLALAQTQHDRIDARGQVKTDKFVNRATIILTGATPDVSGGNVFIINNVSPTTVTNLLGGVDTHAVTIECGEANSTFQNNSHFANAGGTDFVCGANKTISYIYFAAQAQWVQSGTGSAGGGGGGSPGAPANCIQKNNGSGAFSCSGESSDGTTFTVSEDQVGKGPNPNFNILSYGAYSSFTPGTASCSITAASTALSCGTNPDFANGHGIVIPKAGAATALATPPQATVTPTGILNGVTSYSYQIIAEDRNGALTAAGAAGTTSTGAASLGPSASSITLTSCVMTDGTTGTLGGSVATYTSSGNHNLQTGVQVDIEGFTGGVFDSCNGTVTVVTTPTATTFTVFKGQVGAETNTTGSPTAQVYACNELTFPASSVGFNSQIRYWIYRNNALVGVQPGLDPHYVDCGLTVTGAPAYVPSTPPGSSQVGYLVTTIVSGGGTTSLVLANAATTTATSQTVLHDNVPALRAAIQAAFTTGGGTVYIPNGGGFVFNSIFDATAGFTNVRSVRIQWNNTFSSINQPWLLRSSMSIEGDPHEGTSFQYVQSPRIAGSAHPMLYVLEGQTGIYLKRIQLNPAGVMQTGFMSDEGPDGGAVTGIVFDDVTIKGNNGTSKPLIIRGGFDFFWNRGACDTAATGLRQHYCVTFSRSSTALTGSNPLSAGQIIGRVKLEGVFFAASGMEFDCRGSSTASFANSYTLKGSLFESVSMPFVKATGCNNSQLGNFLIDGLDMADNSAACSTPVVDAAMGGISSVIAYRGSVGCGRPPFFITTSGSSATLNGFLGQPGNVDQVSHLAGSQTPTRAFYRLATLPAPAVAVSAGGSVPIGTIPYQTAAVDIDGNETTVSPATNCVTTSGNQTCTTTAPTLPSGSIGWRLFRSGALVNTGFCPGILAAGVNFVDTFSFGCGQSSQAAGGTSLAGASVLGPSGVSTPNLRLMTSGFTTTITGDNAANRTVAYPAASGTVCLTAACTVNSITVNGDAALSSSPRAVPPVFFPGALTTTWTGASWTLDKAITVTRVQSAVKVVPAGCSTSAIVRVTDGSTPINLTINAATNDSGVITQNYAAGATITVSVQTAAAGCTTSPGDLNVSIQSRMQ